MLPRIRVYWNKKLPTVWFGPQWGWFLTLKASQQKLSAKDPRDWSSEARSVKLPGRVSEDTKKGATETAEKNPAMEINVLNSRPQSGFIVNFEGIVYTLNVMLKINWYSQCWFLWTE